MSPKRLEFEVCDERVGVLRLATMCKAEVEFIVDDSAN